MGDHDLRLIKTGVILTTSDTWNGPPRRGPREDGREVSGGARWTQKPVFSVLGRRCDTMMLGGTLPETNIAPEN